MDMKTGALEIAREYKTALAALLGDDLLNVFLYGSQARGDADEGSDIDIICLMKGSFDYGSLIKRTSEITAAISLSHDVIISRVFATKADFDHRQLPFFMNVRRDRVAV